MIRVKRETRQSVKKAEEKKNLPWKILDYFVKVVGSSLILFFLFLIGFMIKMIIR